MQMISGELVVSGVSSCDITVKPETFFPWRTIAVLMHDVLTLITCVLILNFFVCVETNIIPLPELHI